MLEPKERAIKLCQQYISTTIIETAKLDVQGKIELLSELNSVKLCKFDKEIDYWNEVLKELESL